MMNCTICATKTDEPFRDEFTVFTRGVFCSEICYEWRNPKKCSKCRMEFPFNWCNLEFCSEVCSRIQKYRPKKKGKKRTRQARTVEFLFEFSKWVATETTTDLFQFSDLELEIMYEDYLKTITKN